MDATLLGPYLREVNERIDPARLLALIGFATLLFNFVGVNFFFGQGSMHSYA